MAAVYEDNFGYYDLEADPDEPAFFAFVKSQSKLRKCLRCSEPVHVAARSRDLRAMLRRDGIRRRHQVRPKRGSRPVAGLRTVGEKRGNAVRRHRR